MSQKIHTDEFKPGFLAENVRTNEDVRLVSRICPNENCYEAIWIVEGKANLYLEHEDNLYDPFYYG